MLTYGELDDSARAIRLLFQPLIVFWPLWSTTAAPKETFKRFWNYIELTNRENKVKTIIGILIGGVGTRFLEDSNILVNAVVTFCSIIVWPIYRLSTKDCYPNSEMASD